MSSLAVMEETEKFKKRMNVNAGTKDTTYYKTSRRIPYGKNKCIPLTIADLEMTQAGKKLMAQIKDWNVKGGKFNAVSLINDYLPYFIPFRPSGNSSQVGAALQNPIRHGQQLQSSRNALRLR